MAGTKKAKQMLQDALGYNAGMVNDVPSWKITVRITKKVFAPEPALLLPVDKREKFGALPKQVGTWDSPITSFKMSHPSLKTNQDVLKFLHDSGFVVVRRAVERETATFISREPFIVTVERLENVRIEAAS